MAKTTPPEPPSKIEVFYHTLNREFWFMVNGAYLCLKKSELFLHLKTLGLRDDAYHKADIGNLRELDWVLWNAQCQRQICFAGPLAGHKKGLFSLGSGQKVLVTEQAAGVWDDLPKKFPLPKFFCAFIEELLPEGQAEVFCHWLAIALRSLRRGDFRPGQVSVLAGPVQCGKSLLQDMVTQIFGGREANPMRYMMEETPFNEDLLGAEHWKIEEPKTSTDIRTRVAFGNSIKECFTNRDFSGHPKGGKAQSHRIFRRGTISINDDSELLIVLPPLNGSIDDKMHLFKCARVTKAFNAFRGEDGTPALLPEEVSNGELDQAELWAHVLTEIPLIRAWLLKSFTRVPKEMRDDRFGVAAYHNPELKQLLVSFAPEIRLLELIDEILFADVQRGEPLVAWEGKAIVLEDKLRKSTFAFEAEKSLRHMGRLGSYLGKLLKSEPKRVSKRTLEGHALWTIHPPSQTNGEK